MMPARHKDIIEELRRHFEELPPSLYDPSGAEPRRSLTEALSADALALIVEPKRATLHRGLINPDLNIAELAKECQAAGAAAISIVTDPQLSGGRLSDITNARAACDLPLLARDFIVAVQQVRQLHAAGADALLIPVMAFLDEDDLPAGQRLEDIVHTAGSLGMEVVMSVRSEEELECALEADPDALNIDNRDDNGHIDVERTFELLAAVPVGHAVISESVAAADEVARLHRAGVDALLLDEGHLDAGLSTALAVFSDLTLD